MKLRIPIAYQGRSAKHKATISFGRDQVVELEINAPCKSDLARAGYWQDQVRQKLQAVVLPGDTRPIACLSYLPACVVAEG